MAKHPSLFKPNSKNVERSTLYETDLPHVGAIKEALAEMKSGKGIPHSEAMLQIRSTISKFTHCRTFDISKIT